ncbi:hypothetical protein [Listeria innocua]|uniref:hypothetical protein n=1 Tax=Listeria innocua TaxID=1642 RepID=UPI001628A1CF|nr:hypothetical protein [Listeria innocua]
MIMIKFSGRQKLTIDKEEMFNFMMKHRKDEIICIELYFREKPCPVVSIEKINGICHTEQLNSLRYRYMQAYEEQKEQLEKWD